MAEFDEAEINLSDSEILIGLLPNRCKPCKVARYLIEMSTAFPGTSRQSAAQVIDDIHKRCLGYFEPVEDSVTQGVKREGRIFSPLEEAACPYLALIEE
jgi:hypothetical protein